jgi:hypothetical protein
LRASEPAAEIPAQPGPRAEWRRGWDSNPRLSFPNTRFPSVLLKPLGHLSVFEGFRSLTNCGQCGKRENSDDGASGTNRENVCYTFDHYSGVVQLVARQPLELVILVRVQAPEPLKRTRTGTAADDLRKCWPSREQLKAFRRPNEAPCGWGDFSLRGEADERRDIRTRGGAGPRNRGPKRDVSQPAACVSRPCCSPPDGLHK